MAAGWWSTCWYCCGTSGGCCIDGATFVEAEPNLFVIWDDDDVALLKVKGAWAVADGADKPNCCITVFCGDWGNVFTVLAAW